MIHAVLLLIALSPTLSHAQVTVKNPGVRSMRIETVKGSSPIRHRFVYHSAKYNLDQTLGRDSGYTMDELLSAPECVADMLRQIKLGVRLMSANIAVLGSGAYLYSKFKAKEAPKLQDLERNLKIAMEQRLVLLEKQYRDLPRTVKLKHLAKESTRLEKAIAQVKKEISTLAQTKPPALSSSARLTKWKNFGEMGMALGTLFFGVSYVVQKTGAFDTQTYDYLPLVMEYVTLQKTKLEFEGDGDIVRFKQYLQATLFCLN